MRWTRLILVAALVAAAVPALAQRSTATLRGTVADSTGGVVPGATVTAKNSVTGFTRSVTTNANGIYLLQELPVGTYNLTVELAGFKTMSKTGIELNVADVRESEFKLETGAISETVSVVADTLVVKTSGGEVAGLVTGEQVRELPLNGRNFLQLAMLMPGVSSPDSLNVKDKGLLSGSDMSVSGAAVTSNLWTVDGTNNNDVGSQRTILVYPSVDAIEEFKIHRNSYGAEYGQAGGAIINIVTRGGTNEFHGSAYYFGRRDALNANNYFLEKAEQPKNNLNRNDFGWTLGGPIVKDKLHFFASMEWNREKRGIPVTALVPTAAQRVGDFSQPVVNADGTACGGPTPTDPLTGQPFPGNQIPANRLSAGGLDWMKLYPLPNLTTPTTGNCNNWVTSLDSPINYAQINARVDWTLSNTARLMVRYTQDSWTNSAPPVYTNLWGDDAFPAVSSNWDQPSRSAMIQLTNNIGTKSVNTLTFSYSGNAINIDPGDADPGLVGQIHNTIPSIYPLSSKPYGEQTGAPFTWGLSQGYGSVYAIAPFRNHQNLWVLKDDYSAVFGKHLLKAGVLASTNIKSEDTGSGGGFQNSAFWGSAGLNGWNANTGNILSDFLLKDITFGFSETAGNRQMPTKWNDLEFYVADTWKVRPRVTVDYGVRWSMLLNYYTGDDKMTSFVPSLFNPALGGDPCNGLSMVPGTNPCQTAGYLGGTAGPNRSLQNEKYDALAPRLGVAWDVFGTGKTAVRAGLGLFYMRERISGGLNFPTNPPFGATTGGLRYLDSNAEPYPGAFSVSGGAPGSGRDPNAVIPSSWTWNLTFEQQLAQNTTLELSYVGTKQQDQLHFYDVDQVSATADLNKNGVSDRLDYVRAAGDAGVAATVRPYGVFGDRQIVMWYHEGEAQYHGLQAQVVSRFGRGSQFQASYTWSKSTGNLGLADSGGLDTNNSVTDLANPRLDWGPTLMNRPHIFNASLVLMLPTFENKSGFVKNVLGDWEIASIVQASSGQSMTVFTSGSPNINTISGTGYGGNQRPNRVAGVSCQASGGAKEQILNPAAFTLTGFQLGTIGNAGRGICEGPRFYQTDLSLYKNIRVSNRVKMQLRFEMFNIFNNVNFLQGSVNNTFNPTTATYDADPANATTITGYTVPLGFGQAGSTRDARQAQFGIKLMF